MTVTDSQLAALTALRSEIEGIDRATRESASATVAQPESAVSYSFGLLSSVSSIADADATVADIVASIRATLARLAPVYTLETSSGGFAVRSVIQYTGRVASVWSEGSASSSAAAAHLEALEKTYALRIAFAGAIAAVGSTMVAISMAMANPLTVLHALASAKALKQALERLSATVAASG